MLLKELVDHFNNKFEQQHRCNFQPFLLKNNQILGVFGIKQIKTEFIPVKKIFNYDFIAGYTAKTIVSTHEEKETKIVNLHKMQIKLSNKQIQMLSVISFDRVCRTVHLLNYLGLVDKKSFLITQIDPQHILGLSDNHGLYFEEVIAYAGLKTKDIIVSVNINGLQLHYPKLIKGLNNYRRRGYPIALVIDYLMISNQNLLVLEFIKMSLPEYIIINSGTENNTLLHISQDFLNLLSKLKGLVNVIEGKIIMQGIEKYHQTMIAERDYIDFIIG